MVKSLDDSVFVVPENYRTPASAYPLTSVGKARLVRRNYTRGFFDMCGVNGFKYYRLTRSWPVTALQIQRKTWMVDDPLHWESIQDLANKLRGPRVLVAGLGLGLILHALARRSDLTEIIVVERDEEVIALVEALLPADVRRRIIHADFWTFANESAPDRFESIFWDLAVGDAIQLWRDEVSGMYASLDQKFGQHADIYMFGFEGIVSLLRYARAMVRELVRG